MAFVTAKQVSRLAVGLLTRDLVLPMTVARIPGSEYAGSNGDTVTVRVPQPGVARRQETPGSAIDYDDISEVPVDVTLSHLYHATKITDEQLSLEIEDFGVQVTSVQSSAVATGGEDELADAMNAMPADIVIADDGSDIETAVLQGRTLLGRAHVPGTERWMAASPEVAAMVMSRPNLSFADAAASDSALREAIIGRYRGFQVVETPALDEGTAMLYHRTGFAFANRVPVVPRGAAASATATSGGIGLRHIFQYDPNTLSDASVISTFAGASLVDADRVVKLSIEES